MSRPTPGSPDRPGPPHDRPGPGGGPLRFCPACYEINPWAAATCSRCDAPLETPRDYDARLVWALEHPDGGTAVRAAGVLAARGKRLAVEPLGRMSRRTDDPYRAAAAVRALRAFSDDPVAATLVGAARSHPSVIVRRAAEEDGGVRPAGPRRPGGRTTRGSSGT
jgi:HEAT repeats